MINVQMFHNGVWHDAILKEVWYVPDASAQLFSVKIAAPYSTILNEKEIVIRRGDGIIASSGKLVNYHVLGIWVCIPRYGAEVHLAT